MENKKVKETYEEAKMETVLLSAFDIVTASDSGTSAEDGWENLPPSGWV